MGRFSDEVLNQVTSINIIDWAINNGYEVSRKNSQFKINNFGGLLIDAEGQKWNCFSDDSKEAGGGIIQFVMYMEQLEFRNAVEKLMAYKNIFQEPSEQAVRFIKEAKEATSSAESFELPKRAENYRRLYAYLIKTRELDKSIVDYYVRHHKIYEDDRHNVVFCGGDENGVIRSASRRGTYDLPGKDAFKGLVKHSDKHYPFSFEGKSDRLLVFEAPIDMMSYQTLLKETNQPKTSIRDSFIALNGIANEGFCSYLETHPHIKRICFCLDNDEAGINSTANLIKIIDEQKRGLYELDVKVPITKDWNQDLKEFHLAIENENSQHEMEM